MILVLDKINKNAITNKYSKLIVLIFKRKIVRKKLKRKKKVKQLV